MNTSKGFTLIELVITIAVLSLGIIGVYSAFNPIVVATYNLSSRLTATYLAEEGMEVVRNIRDTNVANAKLWSAELAGCSLGCQLDYKTGTNAQLFEDQLKVYDDKNFLVQNADGFYGYGDGQKTLFTRKITITQNDSPDIMKVQVQVFWNYNGQPLSFQTSGYLYNYR